MKTNPDAEPWLLTIDQAAKLLSIGRTKVYELIAHEGLPIVRFGRAVRIQAYDLQQWLNSRKAPKLYE